jgi:hypothetical protein
MEIKIKTLFIVLILISIHIFSIKVYNTYCIGEGWYSIMYSLIYVPTPQCIMLLNIAKYTSDLYIVIWITLFVSILRISKQLCKNK